MEEFELIHCRVDLHKTNYKQIKNAELLKDPPVDALLDIYEDYCRYNKFKSFMPIFPSEFEQNDVIGYYDKDELVAFSIIQVYDDKNIEAYQFAWNYKKPKLHLGIKSLRHECAYYKHKGFKYLYLGPAHKYKEQIQGFEKMGPLL